MKTIKTFIFLVLLAQYILGTPVFASLEETMPSNNLNQDMRVKVLREYLNQYNSPLKGSAQDFVEAADKYNVDWKLVASIAGVESTFGKHIPGGYNGWGWGVYGDKAIYFKSWRHGIFTVTEGLRRNYLDKGYLEPYSMNKIYAASPTWGTKVTYFMKDIDKFQKSKGYFVSYPMFNTQIAGQSGMLAYK